MKTIAGIFNSRADAGRAYMGLRSLGIPDEHVSVLAPGTSGEELEAAVPTTETEQPGMGKALGGAVGGALGVAGGMHIGAAVASLFVPGVGPILAAGLIGAALLGTGGAAAGVAAGGTLEENIATGLPHDELYVYEDALRRGRSVVVAVAADDAQAEAGRNVLAQAGAESIDAARENWWIGLRNAEEEQYAGRRRNFKTDELIYRRGFEASLHPSTRGKDYDEVNAALRERYGEECEGEPFRYGYERGCAYYRELRDKYKA